MEKNDLLHDSLWYCGLRDETESFPSLFACFFLLNLILLFLQGSWKDRSWKRRDREMNGMEKHDVKDKESIKKKEKNKET